MDKKTIKDVENVRQFHTNALVKELLKSENLVEAKKHRDWLEIAEPIIDEFYVTKKSVFWHTAIAFMCLLCMGFLWTCHIKTTQLSFEVISPNVMIKLSESWKLSKSFKLTEIFINNLDIILAPNIDIKFSRIIDGNVDMDQESATLEMSGNSIWLKELNIPRDTLIDLELNKDRLFLYSKGNPFAGKINAENATLVLLTEEEALK